MLSKKSFPLFNNYPDLIYLDGAATSQTPQVVLDIEREWYEKYNGSTHRGLYKLSVVATNEFEKARLKIAAMFGVLPRETVFTKNTTEGINLIADSYKKYLKSGDSIVISALEHHSNILPWMDIAKEKGAQIKIIPVKDGRISLEGAKRLIDDRTKIVSIAHISNVFGTIQPVKDVAKLALKAGAIMVVDGAQAAPHLSVKPWEIGADCYVFSGHKVYAPNGVGVVFVRQPLAQRLDHFWLGGGTVEQVTESRYKLRPSPWRFEAGTQNSAGAVALGKALEVMHQDLEKHQNKLGWLKTKLYSALTEVGAEIYSPKDLDIPLISFNIKVKRADKIALALDGENIAVRSGYLCAQPLVSQLCPDGVVRASAGLWNDLEDIDKLKTALVNFVSGRVDGAARCRVG